MSTFTTFFDAEIPVGDIDGINVAFNLQMAPTPAESLILTYNGQTLSVGIDYSISGKLITFFRAPSLGAKLIAWYRVDSGTPPVGIITKQTSFADQETPGGIIDGLNKSFTISPTPSTPLIFFWNGQLLTPPGDYSLAGQTLNLNTPPIAGDILKTWYQKLGADSIVSVNFVFNEALNGPIDGVNKLFSILHAPFPPESLILSKNGIILDPEDDYTLSGNIITLAYSANSGDVLSANYRFGLLTTERLGSTAKLSLISYIRNWLNDAQGKLWSDTTILRYITQAESEDITVRVDLRWLKFAIPINAGQGLYQIPSNLKSITRVTWLGFHIEMVTQRQLSLLSPVYRTQISKPRWCTLQFEGYSALRFFPIPPQNVPVLSDSKSIYTDKYEQKECQISCYVYSDPDNPNIMLPDYMALRSIRYFVLWNCFAMEGNGQDEDVALYWKGRYDQQLIKNKRMIDSIYASKERQYTEVGIQRPWRKHSPILPPNFGSYVDY